MGRPRFDIPKEQLQYFVDWDLTTVDIAQALGVSQSTIKRRLREYGISIRRNRTVITGALAGGVRWARTHPPPPPRAEKVRLKRVKDEEKNAKDEYFLLIRQRTQLFTVYKTYSRLFITYSCVHVIDLSAETNQ